MKGLFVTAGMLLLLASSCLPSEPSPIGDPEGGWNLVFGEEFDGPALNTEIWEPSWFAGSEISFPANPLEDACYSPSQLSIVEGHLRIEIVENDNPHCLKRGGTQASYMGGVINGRGYEFTYGYAEARIFLDGVGGYVADWPAFWLRSLEGRADEDGEIDIMEGLSGRSCWHFHYIGAEGSWLDQGSCLQAPDWNGTGWHTYGVNWESGRLTFFYDNMLVGTHEDSVSVGPHYPIITLTATAEFGPIVEAFMLVDYVRIWERPS